MLRTAQLLPPPWLLTLGFDPPRFQTEPPACYRASWDYPDRTFTGRRRRASHQVMIFGPSPPDALGAQNVGPRSVAA